MNMVSNGLPSAQGLYDPSYEKDNCGVGFIANIKGEKSHEVVKKGIEILVNMTHRGAAGSDPTTGDGAGLMVQIPHEFFKIACTNLGMELPEARAYAVGMMFLPKTPAVRYQCEGITERIVEEEGASLIGWRLVPVDNRSIGDTARYTEPIIKQVIIGMGSIQTVEAFEAKLYLIRKRIENEIAKRVAKGNELFYICSMSNKTIVYKGLLLPEQIASFYIDLDDLNFKSAMAMVHSRFSTNTFPTWELAHPYRYLAHNGEINTIRGNRNWMNAREGVLKSDVYQKDVSKLFPILTPNMSDSGSLDNVFELLRTHGKSNSHALTMLIPEAWENDLNMNEHKRCYYEYNASMVEPWDGPAAVFFCDGDQVGATLDRNGLRPAKYVITNDGFMVMASELGVIRFEPERIMKKGRLEPGKMIMVDINKGAVIEDEAIKAEIYESFPYLEAVNERRVTLDTMPEFKENYQIRSETLTEKQYAFGYTLEDIHEIVKVMAETGKEPIGAMGNDAPLAVFSDQPQTLFNYFRQLFAQVTNPPIDPIREKIVMSLKNYIGSQASMLSMSPDVEPFIEIPSPVLNNIDMGKIRSLRNEHFKSTKIPITFKADLGVDGFKAALQSICERASRRVAEGYNILILSDKKVDGYEASIPSLLAVSAIHHHLIAEKTRTKVSIIVESGDARDTTHIAMLVAYGASAVNPYLAIETARELARKKIIHNMTEDEATENYVHALSTGLQKILSKMGICTVQSYHGAQIFEALGLSQAFVDQYFPGTPSRIGGLNVESIAKETISKHHKAFNRLRKSMNDLEIGGQLIWRNGAERHLFNPETISLLQRATRNNDFRTFQEYTRIINNQAKGLSTVRGMFELINAPQPISIDEVEPVSEILKRFVTGAMSFGSLSKEVHETIAIAMNRIGARSNSGEGGEDPARYQIDDEGNNRRSAIKQVASARFGVNTHYIMNADELQIKVAQGAKPGEGGHLPGPKVDAHIARVRHSTPGIDLISPPPHHDIYSIEDLAQLIYDLKSTNPKARISVKLVAEVGVGTIAAGVAKAHADMILISGHDGGTGASPISSIKTAGVPWEIGLSEAHQVLLLNNLRSRVRLQTDGQLKTGRDIVIAALLGAEEFGFATTALVVMGCTMLRHCNKNNCDLGIATQDPDLRKNFKGRPEYLINFLTFMAMEARQIMADMGFRTIEEMVGRVDKIKVNSKIDHWKAVQLDLDKVLYRPDVPSRMKPYCTEAQDHGIDQSFDHKLMEAATIAMKTKKPIQASFEINNVHRTVGSMLSGEIIQRFGEKGLPEDTLTFRFRGSAGQSFGAFGAPGLTLILEGDTNDYVGKSLSGAKIVVKPSSKATFNASENFIAGNTILYGATAGELYINGRVGERFGVRNSGASAVVEGVGNHGCEYMTGGTVVILGSTGKNFAAGMSGGEAFVYDPDNKLEENCNFEMVKVFELDDITRDRVKAMIEKHQALTDSVIADKILKDWDNAVNAFKYIVSPIYKAIVDQKQFVESERVS
ncbi:glutamate synthase large subunit [Fusibacter paucivorans]|uniref:Glutamate synthase large subunit n=2 Tax=Fusibacter paucivorans TaxID=76009 RepID=A0ABS5PNJ0_9FIRM|nr:glutamate synthase large subunit [Fusibacter paucivorans]MBS7526141.1 glutamate synthase large subunit [Fusibacter paucivorans]